MQRLRCRSSRPMNRRRQDRKSTMPAAIAMIALLKYGTGVPFKRLERLERQLGMPLPAATQWELMAAAAKLLRPVAGRTHPAGRTGQCNAQRRHQHADSAAAARAWR